MGRAGAAASQAKEVSPTGGWIGIRISPARDGLEKGPRDETQQSEFSRFLGTMEARKRRPQLLSLDFRGFIEAIGAAEARQCREAMPRPLAVSLLVGSAPHDRYGVKASRPASTVTREF